MENAFLKQNNITHFVKKSKKAKRLRLLVNSDKSVTVTIPYFFPEYAANSFIKQKLPWIKKSIEYFKKFEGRIFKKPTRKEYLALKEKALVLAKEKLEFWNKYYKFTYNRVSIKNQKTRWGSCSRQGNLNFNYKIVNLPENLLDYLIVHELCHLKELNHSRNFWSLVSNTIPEYKKLRSELKNYHNIV